VRPGLSASGPGKKQLRQRAHCGKPTGRAVNQFSIIRGRARNEVNTPRIRFAEIHPELQSPENVDGSGDETSVLRVGPDCDHRLRSTPRRNTRLLQSLRTSQSVDVPPRCAAQSVVAIRPTRRTDVHHPSRPHFRTLEFWVNLGESNPWRIHSFLALPRMIENWFTARPVGLPQ